MTQDLTPIMTPIMTYDVGKTLHDHKVRLYWQEIENDPRSHSRAAYEAWKKANEAKKKIVPWIKVAEKRDGDFNKRYLPDETRLYYEEYVKWTHEMRREVENPPAESDW